MRHSGSGAVGFIFARAVSAGCLRTPMTAVPRLGEDGR
jgi:hypothetical protein